MNKEYPVMAKLNDSYIMFIANLFGGYNVMVKSGEHVYTVYGGYRNIGTAANRLLKNAATYHSNPIDYKYATKEALDRFGPFEV